MDLNALLTLKTLHRGSYQVHFSDEKTEAQREFAMPAATELFIQ